MRPPARGESYSVSRVFLHPSIGRGEHEVLRLIVVFEGDRRSDRLAWLECEEIGDMLTFCIASGFRQFVSLDPIDSTQISEEQMPCVRRSDSEMLDDIVTAQKSPSDPFPPR